MPGIETAQMSKQEVKVGTVSDQADYRRVVRFTGAELASVTTRQGARSRDDRGQTYTLYAVPGGGYRVHLREWSRWQGETDDYSLSAVLNLDLLQRQYPALANAAGLIQIVDLDEDPGALDQDDDGEE